MNPIHAFAIISGLCVIGGIILLGPYFSRDFIDPAINIHGVNVGMPENGSLKLVEYCFVGIVIVGIMITASALSYKTGGN